METNQNDPKQKKGFLAAIWESLTKTGGCCGAGDSCCGSPKLNDDKQKEATKKDAPPSSCCSK